MLSCCLCLFLGDTAVCAFVLVKLSDVTVYAWPIRRSRCGSSQPCSIDIQDDTAPSRVHPRTAHRSRRSPGTWSTALTQWRHLTTVVVVVDVGAHVQTRRRWELSKTSDRVAPHLQLKTDDQLVSSSKHQTACLTSLLSRDCQNPSVFSLCPYCLYFCVNQDRLSTNHDLDTEALRNCPSFDIHLRHQPRLLPAS